MGVLPRVKKGWEGDTEDILRNDHASILVVRRLLFVSKGFPLAGGGGSLMISY